MTHAIERHMAAADQHPLRPNMPNDVSCIALMSYTYLDKTTTKPSGSSMYGCETP